MLHLLIEKKEQMEEKNPKELKNNNITRDGVHQLKVVNFVVLILKCFAFIATIN